MFCSKCGYNNPANVTFCEQCGNRMEQPVSTPAYQNAQPQNAVYTQPQQSVPYANQPVYQQAYKAPAPKPKAPVVRSSNPVINALKGVGSSPVFLIAVISFSVTALFTFISSLIPTGSMINTVMYELFDELDIPFSYGYGYGYSYAGKIIGAIFSIIPSALIITGLWLTFCSAASKTNGTVKTAGLTIIKVMMIITLVFACIAAGFCGIACIIGMIAAIAGASYDSDAAIAVVVMLVLMLVVAALFVFIIIYYSQIIKSINSAKQTALTGKASGKASGFVAVMCFIGAGFSVISTFVTIIAAFASWRGPTFGTLLQIFASIASITASVCFGITMFKYNGALKQYITPVSAPAKVQKSVNANTYVNPVAPVQPSVPVNPAPVVAPVASVEPTPVVEPVKPTPVVAPVEPQTYAEPQVYEEPQTYAEPVSYAEETYAQDVYAEPQVYAQDVYAEADPYAQDAYAQAEAYQDPYAQTETYADPYAQDPYAQDPYAQTDYPQNDTGFAETTVLGYDDYPNR